jgi:hypothetical protein
MNTFINPSASASVSTNDLLAQIAQLKAAQALAVAEATERRKLEAQIRVLTNPNSVEAQASLQAKADVKATLQALLEDCAAIVSKDPVKKTNGDTGNREFRPSYNYTFGDQLSLVAGLVTGIKYSVAQHRTQLLAHVGLDEQLVSDLADAFGISARYDKTNHAILPGVEADVDTLISLVPLVEQALLIELDKKKLSHQAYASEKANAMSRAQRQYNEQEASRQLVGATVLGENLVVDLEI